MPKYTVVQFIEDGCVDVIATKWLDSSNNKCFFPTRQSGNIRKLVEACSEPDPTWKEFGCRILYKSGTGYLYNCFSTGSFSTM